MPTKVAKTSDIPHNCGRVFVAAGKELAVFNVAGVFHAIDTRAPWPTHATGGW